MYGERSQGSLLSMFPGLQMATNTEQPAEMSMLLLRYAKH